MKDGRTRQLPKPVEPEKGAAFLERMRVVIVTLSGTTAGNEYEMTRPCMTLGRGPDVDWPFDDSAMSREHAALEVVEGAVRVRDLGSTNGVGVNGSTTLAAELKHGDRLQVGEHIFQFVIEERSRTPRTYVIDED